MSEDRIESLADRISRGVKAFFGARLVYVGANAVLLLVLTRYLLDPEAYGLLYFAISVLSIGSMLGMLGLPKATGRYITEFDATDRDQVPHVISTSLFYLLVLATTVSIAFAFLHTRLAGWLGDPSLAPLLLLGSLFVVIQAVFTYLTNVFQGFNRVEYSALLTAVNGTSRLVCTVLLVLLGLGVGGALAGYLLGYLLATVVGLYVLRHKILDGYERASERASDLRRRILEYSVPTAFTRMSVVLDSRVDKVLIGALVGPVAVGYYTLAAQISDFCIAPATSLGFTISPAIGEQHAGEDSSRAARLYERSMENVLLLYMPAAVGLVLVAEPTVRLVFGQEYLGAVPILQLFSVFVLVRAIHKITGNGLDYLGLARIRAIARGTTAGGNVVLNLLLIPEFGVIGAAVATVVTYTTYTGVNVYYIHRELGVSGGDLLGHAGRTAVVALLMGGVVSLVLPASPGLVALAVAILVGVVVWALLSVVSGLLDPVEVRSFLA